MNKDEVNGYIRAIMSQLRSVEYSIESIVRLGDLNNDIQLEMNDVNNSIVILRERLEQLRYKNNTKE
jgi:hypothetical protein